MIKLIAPIRQNPLLLAAVLLGSTPLWAAVSQSEIEVLREQVRILSARLDRLEQSNGKVGHHTPTEAQSASVEQTPADVSPRMQETIDAAVAERVEERMAAVSWAERIRWKGDFRYRYENIGVEGSQDRNRQRIRARAHLEAELSDNLQVGLGLASGGSDPVSSNQTLGGGGSTKDLRLDLAYFDWSGIKATHVLAGKFKNQLYRPGKNGLLWDDDWRPEGLTGRWDNGTFFATAIGTWVESDSKTLNREFSFGIQGGFRRQFGERFGFKGGFGYYRFDTAGSQSFFGDNDDFFGNSFDPETLTYLFDYHVIEAYAELSVNFGDFPTAVFVDFIQNQSVDENDMGYAIGLKLGSAKDKGDWEFAWIYQKLEADAALGLLTDSDFGGGGTNARGSIFKGTYAFSRYWNGKATYFSNKLGTPSDQALDFNRLQLDLNFKYK